MARLHPSLLAVIALLAFGSSAVVAPALGASRAHHRTAHARHRAASVRCAQRSSFHAAHSHRPTRRRHSGSRHNARPIPHCRRRASGRRHAHPRPLRRHAPAAVNSLCPDSYLTPTLYDLESIRAAVVCLVNRERTAHGESPLRPDAQLQVAAQRHTEDMAFGGSFEHVGSHGDTLLERLRACGYLRGAGAYEIGENLGWGTLWLATPRAIVDAWMGSPGHRANILDGHFSDTAIGVSAHTPGSLGRGQRGAIYTEDFGVITG